LDHVFGIGGIQSLKKARGGHLVVALDSHLRWRAWTITLKIKTSCQHLHVGDDTRVEWPAPTIHPQFSSVTVVWTRTRQFLALARVSRWLRSGSGRQREYRIVNIHSSRHAITLRSASGAEILMHIGLETVGLDGAGFELLVSED